MTQFHEGQEVEVLTPLPETDITKPCYEWCKAKIVYERIAALTGKSEGTWMVQFLDGTRAVFDAEHIRAPLTEKKKAIGRRMHREFEGRGL